MGEALVFCGIKHCGKSTLGQTLARVLDIPFCDTDGLLEEKFQTSVREFFKAHGEEAFRACETQLLKELSGEKLQVISLGGGALLKEENRALVKDLGILIWCDIDDETAFQRVLQGGLPPFLAQAADPFEEFRSRNCGRRATFAGCCDLRFAPDPEKTPEENVSNLLEILREKGILKI